MARALLSGPRRDALHSALGAIRHAVERLSIPAVLEALAQPPAPTELHAVCAAVAALLVLLSGSSQCARHAVEFAGASASSSAATAVATAAMRSGSVNPMAAQNVALALQLASQQFPRCEPLQRWVSRAKDIVVIVKRIRTLIMLFGEFQEAEFCAGFKIKPRTCLLIVLKVLPSIATRGFRQRQCERRAR